MSENAQSILDTITQFFREDDWNFSQLEGKPMIRVDFKGKNVTFRLLAQAKEDKEQAIFYSILPMNIPPERRGEIAEYLTRANYGLILGNFEMDFSDGEVRYKTSISLNGGQLTPGLVKNMVYANVRMMDRYYPGLMSILYGNMSPAAAVEMVEKA